MAGCAGTGPAPSVPVADPPATDAVAVPAGAFTATVTHISDGDTLWVSVEDPGATGIDTREEAKLRLLRIDTPELARDGQPADCLADEASDALARLVPEGSTVHGAYDVERRDRYGRELVHLWTDDGRWVNGAMLADGYAQVVTFPPNTAYDDEVRALQADARDDRRGLWDPARCPG